MIRYWFDTEFIEDGRTIDLISIGIVSSDGRELYAVNSEAPWKRVKKHPWLMANVVPHLPKVYGDARNHMPRSWLFNHDDPAVKPHALIAGEVRDFLLRPNEPMELWTYYGAYDHVVLAQLFGRMIDLPRGIPMFSHDIMQFASSLGMDDANFPQQTGQVHNALDDARWTRDAWRYLDGYARRTAEAAKP
jgi:hypothetical protein